MMIVARRTVRMTASIARFRFVAGQHNATTGNAGPGRRAEVKRDCGVSPMIGASAAPSLSASSPAQTRGIPAGALMPSGGATDGGGRNEPGNGGIGFCEAGEYPAKALEAAETAISSVAFAVVGASFGDARHRRRHGPRTVERPYSALFVNAAPDTGTRSGGTASFDEPDALEGSSAPFGTGTADDRPATAVPMASVSALQWEFHHDAHFGPT